MSLIYNPNPSSRANTVLTRRRAEETKARALGRTVASSHLSSFEREAVTLDLMDHGLDGNGRFRSVSHALGVIGQVLAEFGLEFTSTITAWDVAGPKGHRSFEIGRSNNGSPIVLSNSGLALSWYELSPGMFECVAYLG